MTTTHAQTLTAALAEDGLPVAVRESRRSGPPLFGYELGPWTCQDGFVVRPLQIRQDQADAIRMLFTLHAQGESALAIAGALNQQRAASPRGNGWEKTSVAHVLGNLACYAPGSAYPTILEAELATRAATAKTRRNRSSKAAYAFQGLVTCGLCGNKMEADRYNRSRDDAGEPVFVKYRCRKGGHDTVSFQQQAFVEKVNEWLLANLAPERVQVPVAVEPWEAWSFERQCRRLESRVRNRRELAEDVMRMVQVGSAIEQAEQSNDSGRPDESLVQPTAQSVLLRARAGKWRPGYLRAAYEALGVRFVYEPEAKEIVVNGISR